MPFPYPKIIVVGTRHCRFLIVPSRFLIVPGRGGDGNAVSLPQNNRSRDTALPFPDCSQQRRTRQCRFRFELARTNRYWNFDDWTFAKY